MRHQDRQQCERKRQAIEQVRRIVPHARVAKQIGVEIERTVLGEAVREPGPDHGRGDQRQQQQQRVQPVAMPAARAIRRLLHRTPVRSA